MDASTWPDWERIGRRIGKRLRDVLEPRPASPGPSPEERRAQRLRDASLGLVYFDIFEEVDSWDHANVDPVQQPNQPLLARTAGRVYNGQSLDGPMTKLLLCHDYKGGYHDYESVRPAALDCKWYTCNYLECVDTFIYFSHKLVCIPPATWTNALHRNGVKVLGTILIEPQTPHMERLLLKKDGVYVFAERFADMIDAYGFDGWLFNIEKDAPKASQHWGSELTIFLSDLRKMVGKHKTILWYDALTFEGDVYYQNGFTPMNREFAQAANGLFTNYKWTEQTLAASKAFARDTQFPISDIFFGVDVWAQNTDMPGPKRVTYPPEGGGGTNTGLAMSVLSASGFSTAMFAPAWVYEHFPTSASVGVGLEDGPSIACQERAQQPRFRPSLSSQDPLPNLVPGLARDWSEVNNGPMTRVLYGELNSRPQSSLKVLTKLAGCYDEPNGQRIASVANLRLFNFDMPADNSLAASITIREGERINHITLGFQLTFFHSVRQEHYDVTQSLLPSWVHRESVINLPINEENSTLVALGVFMEGEPDTSAPVAVLEIASIIIRPRQVVSTQSGFQLRDLHIVDRAHESDAQKRIAWNWETAPGRLGQPWQEGMPWSRTTGPFSSFTVLIDDEVAGEAYCLEFPLREEDVKDSGKQVTINVVGHLFGGGFADRSSITVPGAELRIAENHVKQSKT
ncbi:MAG: hypothetical protein Q9207_003797 [Kuettlingeria erythrocarpa]